MTPELEDLYNRIRVLNRKLGTLNHVFGTSEDSITGFGDVSTKELVWAEEALDDILWEATEIHRLLIAELDKRPESEVFPDEE